MKSLLWSLWSKYHHHERAHGIAKKYFGNCTPYVGDLEKSQSMLFRNLKPLVYPPRPNVPVIVEVRQMHNKPEEPLPDISTTKTIV